MWGNLLRAATAFSASEFAAAFARSWTRSFRVVLPSVSTGGEEEEEEEKAREAAAWAGGGGTQCGLEIERVL
jgi:hypothetical protein